MHEESDPVGQAVENLDDLWPPFTAVPPRRGRAPKSQRGPRGSALSRDEIVTTAVALADAEGAEAINMRHIAKELGVGTMSLYWHVGSKEHLLDLMLDAVAGEDASASRSAPRYCATIGSLTSWRVDHRSDRMSSCASNARWRVSTALASRRPSHCRSF